MLLVCGPERRTGPVLFSIQLGNGKDVGFFLKIISLLSLLLLSWLDHAAGRYSIHKPSPQSLTSRLSFLIVLIIQGHP